MDKKTVWYKSVKILLIGKNGQLGFEIHKLLLKFKNFLAVGRDELDLADKKKIRRLIQSYKPNIIINAAAFTEVDNAETKKKISLAINQYAPKIIAEESDKLSSLFIHFSSDYVFDGNKKSPYNENDITNPLNFYGFSKLGGELAVKTHCKKYIILRTSWVVGNHGKNFIKKILDIASKNDTLKVVSDQFGAPTSTKFLAKITIKLIQRYNAKKKLHYGLYHASALGSISWFDLAYYIIKYCKIKNKMKIKLPLKNIIPILSSEFKTLAERPKYSVLDNTKLKKKFKFRQTTWKNEINKILNDI